MSEFANARKNAAGDEAHVCTATSGARQGEQR
jgi:hypothetical protein